MRQAVEAAREAWGLATMCGVAGKGETLDIVPRFLITGRRVTGSSFGGVKGRTQVPLLVDRWLAGEIDVESLISHRIALDEVNHGFELMERQDGIRSVITFEHERRGVGTRPEPGTHAASRLRYERRDAALVSQSQPEANEARRDRPTERAGVDGHRRAVQGGHSGGGELVPDLRGDAAPAWSSSSPSGIFRSNYS